MDVLPLTDVPRPMYEPWKTSIPSPASLQQWPAARWQFPFSLDEGNIPCKLPCVSWENHGKPMVPNGSLWFPMVPYSQSMTESGSALRDATKIVMMTMGPQTIRPLWPGSEKCYFGRKILKETMKMWMHRHADTHRAIHIYWHSFTYTQYTCDVCVYTYIHTHIYIHNIYIILYNMYYIYIYVLFEILRKSPSVSWVPTRHDNIVQMIILCTFAGLLQHFGVDMYRWLNHTKPIVPNP
jgi:hypothetical protein